MPARGEGLPPKTRSDNGETLAQFAGVSRDTIKEWRKKPGFPVDETGATELWALCLWTLRRDGVIGGADDGSPLDQAELRKAQADALLKEIKARQALGQLLDRATVVATITRLFHQVRSRLQAIAGELAATLPPEIRHDLSRDIAYKIELALREMASWSLPGGWKPTASEPTSPNSGKSLKNPPRSKRAAKRSRRGKSR